MILLSQIKVKWKVRVCVVRQGSIKAICPYLLCFPIPTTSGQYQFSTEEYLKDSESKTSRMLLFLSRHIIFDWDDCRG